ncbi:Uncharacterized protein APZ42_000739, partial [Daphnia magna]
WILSIFQQSPGDHVPDDVSTAVICFQDTAKYGTTAGFSWYLLPEHIFPILRFRRPLR